MNADEVAQYLKDNPTFFEDYAELLAGISVPHPHGGAAIALSDRQVLTLRDKNKLIESKLAELIQFGEENDAIGEKMHRLSLALLAASGLHSEVGAIGYNLREDFAVPHVALRFWRGQGEGPEYGDTGAELREFVARLELPYCGPGYNDEVVSWFGDSAEHIRSMSLIPLADGDCFGVLVLASEDPERFHHDMGRLYLKRLGELASAALSRFV
jgi:uncharacterized protein YigA (DUF484 family)